MSRDNFPDGAGAAVDSDELPRAQSGGGVTSADHRGDVGMGVEEIGSKLSGLLRMVFAAPGQDAAQALARIPKPAEERDDYDRNIQVADLNALNAMLAIGRWKRHLGFYAVGTTEGLATYSMYTNHITNENTSDDR